MRTQIPGYGKRHSHWSQGQNLKAIGTVQWAGLCTPSFRVHPQFWPATVCARAARADRRIEPRIDYRLFVGSDEYEEFKRFRETRRSDRQAGREEGQKTGRLLNSN